MTPILERGDRHGQDSPNRLIGLAAALVVACGGYRTYRHGGAFYSYPSQAGTTLDDLAATLALKRSYVVTALSAPDSGVAYVAESIGPQADGGVESFDTQMVTADESGLQGSNQKLKASPMRALSSPVTA